MSKMNIPNRLTVLRIIMIPFVMAFILIPLEGQVWHYFVAAVLFLIETITDFIDGSMARKYNIVTNFGKFLDPLADKFLVFGTFLAMLGSDIPKFNDMKFTIAISLAIMVFRELAVTSVRLVAKNSDGTVIAAAMLGKIKTFSQSVCIIYMLVSDVVFPPSLGAFFEYHVMDYILLIFTVIMKIISGFQYMQKYFKYIDPTA